MPALRPQATSVSVSKQPHRKDAKKQRRKGCGVGQYVGNTRHLARVRCKCRQDAGATTANYQLRITNPGPPPWMIVLPSLPTDFPDLISTLPRTAVPPVPPVPTLPA